ncbi:uncharacterized protein M421DRAFT_37469, partial [Didymella exigua CBS 183.55]
WDHLVKWETGDDSIVGDIEEEEHYFDVSDESPDAVEDTVHDSEEEDDVPIVGTGPVPSRLGNDRVTEIINDCIEKYAEAWKPGKDETKHEDEADETEVPVVYDALQLWSDAENTGKREELADKYEKEAKYYRHRLDILCEEIYKDPGHSEAVIIMKCRNLEVTVDMLERATWLEGIYKLPPDTNSDEDSQEETTKGTDQPRLSVLQTFDRTRRPNLPSEVIDLGTPSASECSESESEPPGNIPATPSTILSPKKPRVVIESRPLSSDPVVFDTIEPPAPAVVAASNPRIARFRAPLGDAPEHASIASVSCWRWAQLEETQDRKRAVSRAIYEMTSTDREVMRQRLQKVGRKHVIREIPACIDMLARGDKRLPGILPQDLPKIVIFTRLFLCWWLCGDFLHRDASVEELEELTNNLRQRSPDPSTFCGYIDTVLSTTFSPKALSEPAQPSQAEIIEISDDNEPPAPDSNR